MSFVDTFPIEISKEILIENVLSVFRFQKYANFKWYLLVCKSWTKFIRQHLTILPTSNKSPDRYMFYQTFPNLHVLNLHFELFAPMTNEECESFIPHFKQLKVLIIQPKIKQIPHLLTLENCQKLSSLHYLCIDESAKIQSWDLEDSWDFTLNLSSLTQLTKFETLVSKCNVILPTNLRSLELDSESGSFASDPTINFNQLKQLAHLDIFGAFDFDKMKSLITQLKSLRCKTLSFDYKLDYSKIQFTNMETISIRDFPALIGPKNIISMFPNISSLYGQNLNGLVRAVDLDLSPLSKLHTLNNYHLHPLTKLPSSITHITTGELSWFHFEQLPNLTNLVTLVTSSDLPLASLTNLTNLQNIASVFIQSDIRERDFARFPKLKRLTITYGEHINQSTIEAYYLKWKSFKNHINPKLISLKVHYNILYSNDRFQTKTFRFI